MNNPLMLLVLLMLSAIPVTNNCPAIGDSKISDLQALDLLKNRAVKPLMLPRALQVADFMTGKPDEFSYNTDSYVTVTGTIVMVKYGSGESCNCHSDDRTTYDYHIELADSVNASKTRIMVCEVSRFTKDSVGMNIGDIKLLIGKQVAIEGYLFYDIEHKQNAYNTTPNGTRLWRGTCWEVHPVFKITPIK